MSALSLWPLMTVDEFLSWPGDHLNKYHQLIDGKPVPIAPSSWAHGALVARLATDLGNHLKATASHCHPAIMVGVQPRAGARYNVRVPDLAVSCDPVVGHLMTGMVFAAEVLSPGNEAGKRDAVRAYLTIPSVREVLVLASFTGAAELLRRQPDGAWPEDPLLLGPYDELVLECFGFRCSLAGLHTH